MEKENTYDHSDQAPLGTMMLSVRSSDLVLCARPSMVR